MPDVHAVLSASASHRWLNCPPSVRLTEKLADKGSEFAAEGTDAHTLCESKVRKLLGEEVEDPREHLSFYNSEMEDATEGYAQYVAQAIEEAKTFGDIRAYVERRLDYSNYAPGGFGTGDCVIVAPGYVHIIDFKYGKGVPVSAEDNPQMKLYAIGAINLLDGLYDIELVRVTIYQPRIANISEWRTSKVDLLYWAENTLKKAAILAYEGKGEYSAGEWCKFCKAKATCRKRAEANLELAKYDFKLGPSLEKYEIEDILDKADALIAWAGDIKEYALERAVAGEKWERYKLVEGRSNRKYINEDQVAAAVQAEGIDPYARKVLGITEMTKLLGKKLFDEILGPLIIKPQGKPVLVERNDKREELEISSAADDFGEIE